MPVSSGISSVICVLFLALATQNIQELIKFDQFSSCHSNLSLTHTCFLMIWKFLRFAADNHGSNERFE